MYDCQNPKHMHAGSNYKRSFGNSNAPLNENFTFEFNIFLVFSELDIDLYATIPAQEPNGSIIITNSSITNGSITYGSVPLDTSSTYDQLDQAKIQW